MEYTHDVRARLADLGLGWFADNPCLSVKDMDMFLKLPKEFLETRLNEAKADIENLVGRFTLTRHNRELKTDSKYSERRCLVVGKVGMGKSSFGNLLIGKDEFKVYHTVQSGTQKSKYAFSKEYKIHVFDTQGFKDSEGTEVDLEMSKIFNIYCEGIHAFIFVLSMSNPRITREDIEVIADLQNTFGREVLDYAFIVLTHAEPYFQKNPEKSLRDYLKEMKSTPLGEALEIIGDNVIAVDNEGVGYQVALTRQVVLEHINEQLARSTKGCYTNSLMKEIQEKLKREQEERERRREMQKDAIVTTLRYQLEEDVDKAKEMEDVIEMMTSGKEKMMKHYFQQVKIMPIDGLSPNDCEAYIHETVKSTTDTILEGLAIKKLKKFMATEIEKGVTDLTPGFDGWVKHFEKRFPEAVEFVGMPFIKWQIGRCLEPLETAQREAEQKRTEDQKRKMQAEEEQLLQQHQQLQAEMLRAKQQKIQADQDRAEAERERSKSEQEAMKAAIISFVLSHCDLHDNPKMIQRMLVNNKGAKYSGDNVFEMIREALEEDEVQKANESYKGEQRQKKRKADLQEVNTAAQTCMSSYLADKSEEELYKCKTTTTTFSKYVRDIADQVQRSVSVELSRPEIEAQVQDKLRTVVETVTDPSILAKIKSFAKALFSIIKSVFL